MKAVTANEYAAMRGLRKDGGGVRKAILLGHNMPGVEKLEKFGKSHQIWVSDEFYKKNKKLLK